MLPDAATPFCRRHASTTALAWLWLALALAACGPAAAPAPDRQATAPADRTTATPASRAVRATAPVGPITTPAAAGQPRDQTAFVDTAWYRTQLIRSVDLWNGGADGSSGMGAYRPDFAGFFHVQLDRQWHQLPLEYTTAVAQSRAIYMQVEAYRAAGPDQGERFLKALNTGVDYLLAHFRDPQAGGFFWEITPQGTVHNDMKHGYGNVHPLFALAQAYSVTRNPAHLQAAREQLALIEQHLLDPAYPGGIRPGFSRDWTTIEGVNNIDTFTHWFEALLALYDVTEGAEREHIATLITTHGKFLVEQLYQPQEGQPAQGYLAYNYDRAWRPAQEPYTSERQWSGARHTTPGHNMELAYLLSRAVERGFDPAWLETARGLVAFSMAYGIDPRSGAMQYETLDYDGQPLAASPSNGFTIWWVQAETARALMHFAVVRGWETGAAFKRIERFFHQYQTDQEYGGLFERLKLEAQGPPQPDLLNKGHVWKVNYHYAMFFAEALRLSAQYPTQLAALAATPAR